VTDQASAGALIQHFCGGNPTVKIKNFDITLRQSGKYFENLILVNYIFLNFGELIIYGSLCSNYLFECYYLFINPQYISDYWQPCKL
jgi:hypothetical protein